MLHTTQHVHPHLHAFWLSCLCSSFISQTPWCCSFGCMCWYMKHVLYFDVETENVHQKAAQHHNPTINDLDIKGWTWGIRSWRWCSGLFFGHLLLNSLRSSRKAIRILQKGSFSHHCPLSDFKFCDPITKCVSTTPAGNLSILGIHCQYMSTTEMMHHQSMSWSWTLTIAGHYHILAMNQRLLRWTLVLTGWPTTSPQVNLQYLLKPLRLCCHWRMRSCTACSVPFGTELVTTMNGRLHSSESFIRKGQCQQAHKLLQDCSPRHFCMPHEYHW